MSDITVTLPYVAFKEMEDELRMLQKENQNYRGLLRYLYKLNDENIKENADYPSYLGHFKVEIDLIDAITGTNLRQEVDFRTKKEEPTEADSSRK